MSVAPTPLRMIRCRKCKKEKSVAFFTPSAVKSAYPICRACLKPSSPLRTNRARGWLWREQGEQALSRKRDGEAPSLQVREKSA